MAPSIPAIRAGIVKVRGAAAGITLVLEASRCRKAGL
jgi:hypothetical protein